VDERGYERVAAATGVVAVVAFLIGFLAPGVPPLGSDPASKVQSFFVDKRTAILIGTLLVWVGTIFLLWFVGALRTHLRRHENDGGRLSALAFGGGVALMATILLGSFITAGLAYNVARTASPQIVKAFYDVGSVALLLTGPPSVVLLGAASLAILRRGALPVWLAWFGLAAAVIDLAAIAPVFSTSGIASPTGPAGFIAFGVSMLWLVATSVALYMRIGAPAGA